jgi:transposase-like protein
VKDDTVVSLSERAEPQPKSVLEQLIAQGARKMLQAAIENEVQEYLQAYRGRRTAEGQSLAVRNGHLPERDLVTGVGPLTVRQPRVRHRDGLKYSSAILPKYLRRVREHRCVDPGVVP